MMMTMKRVLGEEEGGEAGFSVGVRDGWLSGGMSIPLS